MRDAVNWNEIYEFPGGFSIVIHEIETSELRIVTCESADAWTRQGWPIALEHEPGISVWTREEVDDMVADPRAASIYQHSLWVRSQLGDDEWMLLDSSDVRVPNDHDRWAILAAYRRECDKKYGEHSTIMVHETRAPLGYTRWSSQMVILCGLPGSGKSTRAWKWHAKNPYHRAVISRDYIREELGITTGIGTPEQEIDVTVIQHTRIDAVLQAGMSVLVDDTNLDPEVVETLIGISEEWGVPCTVDRTPLLTPIEKCIKRDAKRPNPVGEKVIRELASRYHITDAAKTR